MGDHTILDPQDTPPHQELFFMLPKGQRSTHNFCHDNLDVLGQLDGRGVGKLAVCDGRSDGGCSSSDSARLGGWSNSAFLHTHMEFGARAFSDEEERNKPQRSTEVLSSWRPAYYQDGVFQRDREVFEQKLDSFSEAFPKRNVSLFQNGGRGVIFSPNPESGRVNSGLSVPRMVTNLEGPSASPTPPVSHTSPLVLCPPPAILPLPSLSPPKSAAPQFPSVQLTQPAQADMSRRSAQFSPAPQSHCLSQAQMHLPHSGSALAGKCPPLLWLQQPGQLGDGGQPALTQLQGKDCDSSLMYAGDTEFVLKHGASSHQDEYCIPDHCALQMPVNSPPGHYPQSCLSSLPEANIAPSADYSAAWHVEATHAERSCALPCAPLSAPQSSLPLLPCPPVEGAREGAESRPYLVSQSTASWLACPLDMQSTSPPFYTGLPFSSILQAGRALENDWPGTSPHYTPRPMLNPVRRGPGLYCSLPPSLQLHPQPANQESLWSEEEEDSPSLPQVNVGSGFQAELPQLQYAGNTWSEEPPLEELLWKPWEELEKSDKVQQQVDIFLDLCSSSAVPGGGTNLELALHCLFRCQGDILAAVEMLLLTTPSLAGDYHYCGSDIWLLSERRLFNKAFAIYSKDFSLIHNMVKTKRVSQCVEFYYLSKKLPEQQRKQREREQVTEGESSSTVDSSVAPVLEAALRPILMDGTIPNNALATSFPCKQCGKMFYKIKSRNAHMKIHRQQQDDWRDRNQGTVLTQSLAQARLALVQNPGAQFGAPMNSGLSSPAVPLYGPPHPTWDLFDLPSDSSSFYYDSEGKVALGVAGGAKAQIRWE